MESCLLSNFGCIHIYMHSKPATEKWGTTKVWWHFPFISVFFLSGNYIPYNVRYPMFHDGGKKALVGMVLTRMGTIPMVNNEVMISYYQKTWTLPRYIDPSVMIYWLVHSYTLRYSCHMMMMIEMHLVFLPSKNGENCRFACTKLVVFESCENLLLSAEKGFSNKRLSDHFSNNCVRDPL